MEATIVVTAADDNDIDVILYRYPMEATPTKNSPQNQSIFAMVIELLKR